MKDREQSIQDRVAENYETLRYKLDYASHYHDWWVRQMVAMAGPAARTGRVLDNGCGVGVLFKHLDGAKQVVGLDLSFNMLRGAPTSPAHRLQGDSQRLPFADSSFDVVFARSLLHHLPDVEAGVIAMARVLRPGGCMVLADTNRSIVSAVPRMLAYRRENFSDDHQNFHRDDYLAVLRRHFQLDTVRYFGYLAYPFGFPDMMGGLRRFKFPVRLVDALIRVDDVLAAVPGIRTQSWGIMVAATKPG